MPYLDPEKQKESLKKSSRKHYEANREKVQTTTKERRQYLMEKYLELKSTLSCTLCGFSHPAALVFHHRDPKTKLYNVANMPSRTVSWDTILREVEKCDVLCANCHAILHYNEKNGLAARARS